MDDADDEKDLEGILNRHGFTIRRPNNVELEFVEESDHYRYTGTDNEFCYLFDRSVDLINKDFMSAILPRESCNVALLIKHTNGDNVVLTAPTHKGLVPGIINWFANRTDTECIVCYDPEATLFVCGQCRTMYCDKCLHRLNQTCCVCKNE